jgi:hypothetical protein
VPLCLQLLLCELKGAQGNCQAEGVHPATARARIVVVGSGHATVLPFVFKWQLLHEACHPCRI